MLIKIIVFITWISFIGGNVFAAGDLIINGKVGIGKNTPSKSLDVLGNVNIDHTGGEALWINVDTQNSPALGASAFVGTSNFLGGDAFSRDMRGAKYNIDIEGASDNNSATFTFRDLVAQENMLTIGNNNNSGEYIFNSTDLTGIRAQIQRLNNNIRPMTFSNFYGFWSMSGAGAGGSGAITFNNYYHYYLRDFANSATMVAINQYGLYIPNLTGATNNFGIVLAGDGAGSDIVFGPNREAKIYSSGGELFAEDGASNVTQISPHDPETGEWIFYSRNTKTGKRVRVNMERLVKAVEKLTGEKFMIETVEDIE